MPLIDAFAHIGLPRFLSAEEFLRIMDQHKVESAVVTCADTCPDIEELSTAAAMWPDRFRAVGIALGNDPDELRRNVEVQLDAGFSGIRLTASQIEQQPHLLDLLGHAHAVPYVFGPDLFHAWQPLHAFLDAHPRAILVAPHFSGIVDPTVFDRVTDARRLLRHNRFLVIFSRRGAFDLTDIGPLAAFFVREVGWERLMWGSEFPVCLWRNESYLSTTDWFGIFGLKATEAQRKAFLFGNARRYLFGDRFREPKVIDDDDFDLMRLRRPAPVWLFPRAAIELDEETHRTLLLAYLSRGGDRKMPYNQFIANLLSDAARRLEG